MTHKTVYYADVYQNGSSNLIIKQNELIDKSYVYTTCPVFNHYSNRTFVVSSPIDFFLSIERKKNHTNINVGDINHRDLLLCPPDHLVSPLPVFQLKFPKFLFWTYDDDVWFNFLDHPMTSYKNNLIAVNGWFNLSNWTRVSSFAFTMVDESKPVTIKKGDPLHRISFIYPNLDDGIVLKQEKDPKIISKIVESYSEKHDKFLDIKDEDSSWISRLFSKTNSKNKCPVGFLFK
tara:strand:+ start:51 stop:749 length:699 start_codon:yes stop_codon:yes gene_type:complete